MCIFVIFIFTTFQFFELFNDLNSGIAIHNESHLEHSKGVQR